MTRAVVNSGICGFSVTIIAEKEEGKEIHISLDTEYETVKKMAEDISSKGKRPSVAIPAAEMAEDEECLILYIN